MMSEVASVLAIILCITLGLGLFRVAIGPTTGDRMLGIQLLGTTLIALSIILSIALDIPRLLDLALVFAALAGVTAAVFYSSYATLEQRAADRSEP
ncbi:MAG: monovalent cation/H+ antiporter complex subunit F [Sphingorhabdus sp.]